MDNLLNDILDGILNKGGISINAKGIKPNNGYMVSLAGRELILNDAEPISLQVIRYLQHNETFLKDKNTYFGAWVDNGKIYLDVSVNLPHESSARRIGKITKQLAIYDVANQKSIYL